MIFALVCFKSIYIIHSCGSNSPLYLSDFAGPDSDSGEVALEPSSTTWSCTEKHAKAAIDNYAPKPKPTPSIC